MEDGYPDHPIKLFIDTNVVLEAKDLEQLPWREIDPVGPILLLATPQLLEEVDSKKRDGRLGTRARAFNRRLKPLLSGDKVVRILDGPPRVDLAVADCTKIDWTAHEELDPDEGDHRLVLEVLHAKGVPASQRSLASQDLKPLFVAQRLGVGTFHLSDNWLPQLEPGPKDKEITKLKAQVRDLQKTEPEFEVKFDPASNPIQLLRVQRLSRAEKAALIQKMIEWNPKPAQRKTGLGMMGFDHDTTLDGRYEKYVSQTIPAFVEAFSEELEIMFGQCRIRLEVSCVGSVRAENAKIDVRVIGGFANSRPMLVSPGGPYPPQPKNPMRDQMQYMFPKETGKIRSLVGKHEFDFEGPSRADEFMASCEDFRHGTSWVFEGVVALDPRSDDAPCVEVSVTAANLHGTSHHRFPLKVEVREALVEDLINEAGRLKDEPKEFRRFLSRIDSDSRAATTEFEWSPHEDES